MHGGRIGGGQVEAHRVGAGGQQERAVVVRLAVGEGTRRLRGSIAATRAFSRRSMARFS